jgi:hypothetical protein
MIRKWQRIDRRTQNLQVGGIRFRIEYYSRDHVFVFIQKLTFGIEPKWKELYDRWTFKTITSAKAAISQYVNMLEGEDDSPI